MLPFYFIAKLTQSAGAKIDGHELLRLLVITI
ncbi:Uncharacterised protein [Yersinia frederiksenii]|nr:Uncharacterised protein [Yersinia frederiksenii]CNL47142.1 Uncharacterised protein [Yersinia frederiksenii]CNM12862.1 Uncharacterised protein [Yersinia frederiksenii]